jgi:hypothetical protein
MGLTMSEIFGNTDQIRGCFKAFLLDAGASHGAVLKMPSGDYPSTFSDPYLVIGFAAAQAEAVSFTKVFGGRVYTYAFGHDPNASWLNVDMMGFLVDKTDYSNVVEKLNGAYFSDRVTVSLQYAKLGLGMGGGATPMRGFVVGISTQTADPMHSLQRFTVRLALVEAQS